MKLGCYTIRKPASWSLLYLLIGFQSLQAQETLWDVGVAANTSFLMSQKIAESTEFNPGFAVWGRFTKDTRYTLKTELAYRNLSTSRLQLPTNLFGFVEQQLRKNLIEVDVVGELNLWRFASDYSDQDSKTITPYLLAGASLGFADSKKQSSWLTALPVGCGVKLLLGSSLIVGIETTFRFYPGSQIDALYPSLTNEFLKETKTNGRWMLVPSIRLSWILGWKDEYCIN
ncbi:MAG: hypothetical protein ACRDCN_01290 [Tannerellaceae bacterium]